ncbi:nitrilase [Sphingorhabdus lutea]|uniref:Nitrilase n=2 Tax=Sphingorhabdus lutea TaxID=1913578 RepID=A0A1L3JE91_9SPHN|nr:nitrilase [Sphingorhabdus lutea]
MENNIPQYPAPYAAMAMQLTAMSVEKCADKKAAQQQILAMIDALQPKIASSAMFITQYCGLPVKLAVLPEYLFTSYPGKISIPDFAAKAGFDMQGAEYDALGKVAQNLGIYLSGNAYEIDPNFPDLYFQASFIISPSGDLIHRYRRLISIFAPTPHDVWDKYVDIYGMDGVFPVAKTGIGNLATIASEEILYPEIARALAMRGAEIFCHSSSEIGSPLTTPKAIARRARAFENMSYIISANTAGVDKTAMPLASADGNSQFVDYKGKVQAESNNGETFTAFGEVDITALRAARARPAMTNALSRQANGLFADIYRDIEIRPSNGLMHVKDNIPDREYFMTKQEQAIQNLLKIMKE